MNIPFAVVQTASLAGELWSRLSRRATLANRSKAMLSRQKYWVCSASRARDDLALAEPRSLPHAILDTYYWYRQSGWLRDSSGARGAVA